MQEDASQTGKIWNGSVRKVRADKLRELFDKYCPPTMLEIAKNYPTLVPILDFNMAQTLCYFLEGLLVTENVGNKDANSFEIYCAPARAGSLLLTLWTAAARPLLDAGWLLIASPQCLPCLLTVRGRRWIAPHVRSRACVRVGVRARRARE